MNTEIIDAGRDASGGYKVDVSRGANVDRVSSEWFSRPDDERYLSLDDLFASVKGRAERSRTRTVESAAIRVEAHRGNPEKLGLVLPGADEPIAPTHWSFGQLSSLVGAPAAYLRQLPAPLAGINLQYGLTNHRAEQIKTMEVANGRTEFRAVTGPDYGRIYDHELVSAVQRIAGNGTGDTRWKVPGVLDWSTGIYNPRVDVTKETTTLNASDRAVFLFLVDDLNPIEAGLLPNGSPDLYFRGFYCWNSEVGAKTLGIASFYLRAVCQNRNLWGVEDFQEITIRHSKYAASRFAHQAAPALSRFAESSPAPFIDGIRAAREKFTVGRRPSGLPAQARVLESGDRADRRDGVGRRRPPTRKRRRLRAGDHRSGPFKATAGCAAGDGGQGEDVAGEGVMVLVSCLLKSLRKYSKALHEDFEGRHSPSIVNSGAPCHTSFQLAPGRTFWMIPGSKATKHRPPECRTEG